MATTILYCWELGMGLGHVSRMNAVSQRPEFEGCEWHFALQEVHKCQHLARFERTRLWQAPYVRLQSMHTSVNFSHLMARCGFVNKDSALALISSWQNLITRIQPDVVMLDHSPGAAAAAALLGVPSLHIGNGFEVPPVAHPMPMMQPMTKADPAALEATDQALNRVLDEVEYDIARTRHGLLHVQQLYRPERVLIAGYPSLDHYGERAEPWRYLDARPVLSAKTEDHPVVEHTSSRRIFYYLDINTPNLEALLSSLATQFSLFGTMRGPDNPDLKTRLRKAGVKVFDAPLPIEFALSQADLVFCHCGAGLMNNVFAQGLPSLLLPLQLEQSMIAYQVSRKGFAKAIGKQVNPNELTQMLHSQWDQFSTIKPAIARARHQDEARFWQGNILQDIVFA